MASIESHADAVHIDIMDGHFVPNLSFGMPILRSLETSLPLDVHLMVSNPSDRFDELIDFWVSRICFHVEVDEDISKNIVHLRAWWVKKVGLAIDNQTSYKRLLPYLDLIDYVIVMTVQAGFAGQKFNQRNLQKVINLKKVRSDIEIMIDGGVNQKHAFLWKKAGVDSVAATSWIFWIDDHTDRQARIQDLKKL